MIRLAAFFLAATLSFSAANAKSPWMQVELSVDIAAGVVAGEAVSPDGARQAIRIERPPLTKTRRPYDGYIGPSGALLPANSGWLPPLPDGATGWSVTVKAGEGFLAVPYPDGEVSTEGITRFQLTPRVAEAPLVLGRYDMRERVVDGVALRTFFTAANAAHADAYLDATAEAIAALSDRIGDYPYKAFAVVESPLPVGLGFPGYTLVSGRILPYPFMRGRSLWHEISHVWWGNGVFVDYQDGNWAEGFATFFADYALAERGGPTAAREMRYDWLLAYDALPAPEDAPVRSFVSKSHGQAQVIGYGKAAMILHMLRAEIGEAAFDSGVKRFWRDNRGEVARWSDIQAAFETESGRKLDGFFRRWVDGAGAAPVDIADADFDQFRRLDEGERIRILRAALATRTFELRLLDGAPGDAAEIANAFRRTGNIAAGGAPVYIGDFNALKTAVTEAPGDGAVAGIWATTDATGEAALAIAAPDMRTLAGLLGRVRHYKKWSWLTVGPDGRPKRGRWRPAINP